MCTLFPQYSLYKKGVCLIDGSIKESATSNGTFDSDTFFASIHSYFCFSDVSIYSQLYSGNSTAAIGQTSTISS